MAIAPLNQKATRKQVEIVVGAGIPVVIFDSTVDGKAPTAPRAAVPTAATAKPAPGTTFGRRRELEAVVCPAAIAAAITLATAQQQGETTRGEGDAQRTRIFAESFGKDPGFAAKIDRATIQLGCDKLGVPLDDHIANLVRFFAVLP